MRHFPEGFYADLCLRQMGAAPPAWERESRPLANARFDPRILAHIQCPNTDGPPRAAPIFLIRLKAYA
nr:hypothetical protein [Phenylobacterium sp.]